MAVDRGNNIWFGTRGRGAARLNGFDDWTLYTSTDDGWLGSNEIEGIDFNSLNQGWFAASGGAYLYEEVASSSSEVTPGDGREVTSPDGRVKATFPPGSVSSSTSVKQEPKESFPSSKAYIVYDFDLSATPHVSYIKPYTLTVTYSDTSLYSYNEEDFGLYWWDGSQWAPEPTSVIDIEKNLLMAAPDHMTLFSMMIEADQIYLPGIIK